MLVNWVIWSFQDECWSELKKTPHECFDNITGIFHGRFHEIKKQCCVIVDSLSDLCWLIIFPSMPYIRFMIKGMCTAKYGLH
ncbi:hypothetical protein CARUB_v10024480mg [Capsella rubella]|uniref:Prolamin-like domain-containing protein n=1 Tax=Capsella rubella TaxID=81985 RepID=R0HF66_9BRAS|nr:hypothetical protein CARUB_v10024480mg [Capsella rubella]